MMKDFQAVIDFLTADSEVPERGEREERERWRKLLPN